MFNWFDFYMEATSYPDIMSIGRADLMDKYNKNVRKSHELFKNPTPDVLRQLAYVVYKGTTEFDDRYSGTEHENKKEVVVGDVRGILFKGDLYCMNANFNYAHWDILDKMIEQNIITAQDFKAIDISSIEQFKELRKNNIQKGTRGYADFVDLFLCVIQDGSKNVFLMGETYDYSLYGSDKLKQILSKINIPPYLFKSTKW